MKEKIQQLWIKIAPMLRAFFSKKRNIIIVIVAIIVVIVLISRANKPADVVTDTVKQQTLSQTVLATGQVTSTTDLSLSFTGSGVVQSIRTTVGSVVQSGTILATLTGGNELAAVTSARGALLAAQAKYQKILDGASSEEITLSEIALRNAEISLANTKTQQATLVENARRALLSNDLEALPTSTSSTATTSNPTISGTYTGTEEGVYRMSVYSSGNGGYFSTTGVESSTGVVSATTPTAFGTKGLFIQFPSGFSIGNTTEWQVAIPNKKSSTYVTYYNAYQNALETQASALASAQSLVDQRTAELALKKATARKTDLDLAQADVLSAQGQMQNAQASYEKTILRAPAKGTITSIDTKVGELAQALKEAIVLQDVSNLYLEANVNEANITALKIGQPVRITYDAFGPEKEFTGAIVSIDPASTLVSGVVNYKIKASLSDVTGIRPGMTANMTIVIDETPNLLVIPRRAVIERDGRTYVRSITNTKKKTFIEKEVILGKEGDGGLIEVKSGLSVNEEIVVLVNDTKK